MPDALSEQGPSEADVSRADQIQKRWKIPFAATLGGLSLLLSCAPPNQLNLESTPIVITKTDTIVPAEYYHNAIALDIVDKNGYPIGIGVGMKVPADLAIKSPANGSMKQRDMQTKSLSYQAVVIQPPDAIHKGSSSADMFDKDNPNPPKVSPEVTLPNSPIYVIAGIKIPEGMSKSQELIIKGTKIAETQENSWFTLENGDQVNLIFYIPLSHHDSVDNLAKDQLKTDFSQAFKQSRVELVL